MNLTPQLKSLIKDSFQKYPIGSMTNLENQEIHYKFHVETIINAIFGTLQYSPISEDQLTAILEIFLTESFW